VAPTASDRDPFLLWSMTIVSCRSASVFYHSHPVLSSPAVPNIMMPVAATTAVRLRMSMGPSVMIKMPLCLPLSKRVSTMTFPLVVSGVVWIPLVFFLSHHFCPCCVPSGRILPNNHQSILHGLIAFTLGHAVSSYPHFPSLPASFGGELSLIHISFGCDTI